MCYDLGIASKPYIQVFNAIKSSDSNSKDEIRWKIPTSIEPNVYAWILESIRVVKPGGKLFMVISDGCCMEAYNSIKELPLWCISKCAKCNEVVVEATK